MRVIDLYAGLKGWSRPFEDRGHDCWSVDIDKQFDVDCHRDVLTMQLDDFPWQPDIVLASPPCEGWSVMQIGTNWHKDHTPKTDKARHAMSLVEHTLSLIAQWAEVARRECSCFYFIIENPRAKLRKMPMMQGLELRTVTYCQYGEHRMKPTDLWGGFPPSLRLKPICHNGAECHIRAPRGSVTGTQGMSAPMAAKIPYSLALDVCLAAERDITIKR